MTTKVIKAKDLKVGDKIVLADGSGKIVKLKHIGSWTRQARYYDVDDKAHSGTLNHDEDVKIVKDGE